MKDWDMYGTDIKVSERSIQKPLMSQVPELIFVVSYHVVVFV